MKAALIASLALGSTALLTRVARKLAGRFGFIDYPNARSSHVVPTPKGGGAAIVLVVTVALGCFAAAGKITLAAFAVLAGGGVAVAAVGLIDDWRLFSTRVRLAVHFCAACWAMFWLGGLPPIQVGGQLLSFGWAGYVLGVLGIVWSLNLFNFMDGIDGIAASEAAFMGIAGAWIITAGAMPDSGPGLIGLTLGAASCGFLVWNWPPATIFLGDVGSGYLGYSLACYSIIAARENPIALPVFGMLGGVFIVDATFTFLRRIARHERYDVGHRTHGYQRLSRRWGSHRAVTLAAIAINLLILLPAAFWAALQPSRAAIATIAVMLLLAVIALIVGSGSPDRK